MPKTKSGFTIIELLIVIVVIAILATISIVAYNGIQNRARASAIASDLVNTEKALRAYKITSGASSWWVDSASELTGAANPSIESIITAQSEFRNYLKSPPTTDGLETASNWIYDYDNDTYNGCSASTAGVNIAVSNVTNTSLMQAVDDAVDDGNLSCGKLRSAGGWFLHAVSNSA